MSYGCKPQSVRLAAQHSTRNFTHSIYSIISDIAALVLKRVLKLKPTSIYRMVQLRQFGMYSLYNHKWQKKCFLQCFDAVNWMTGRHPAHNAECHCMGYTRSVTTWSCLPGIEGAALVTSQLSYPVYKAVLLMVMVHGNCCPVYLSEYVQPASGNPACRRLRSASSLDFIVPRTRTKSGDRASLLPVRQCGTVCLSPLDQLRLLLVISAIWKPICSLFCFNWVASRINTAMTSRSVFVVGLAPLTIYCTVLLLLYCKTCATYHTVLKQNKWRKKTQWESANPG